MRMCNIGYIMNNKNESERMRLRECPFCGGEELRKWDSRIGLWYIACERCGATQVDFSEESVVGKWNRRANGVIAPRLCPKCGKPMIWKYIDTETTGGYVLVCHSCDYGKEGQ